MKKAWKTYEIQKDMQDTFGDSEQSFTSVHKQMVEIKHGRKTLEEDPVSDQKLP